MSVENSVFVGFNSQVLSVDRETGEILWKWTAPKPKYNGYVTMLLDVDRLIVSVNGYLYCLNPDTGEQLWYNETKGCGTGVASIVSASGYSPQDMHAMVAEIAQQQAAAAAASAGS